MSETQNVTRASLALHCKASSGEVGTFLFVPTAEGKKSVSPVFQELASFYPWARREGWTHVEPYNAISDYVRSVPSNPA